jgi:hypothetical protein
MNNIQKLGVGIIAFEGLEHIKNIIYEIRDLTDVIIICLQKLSYHGEPIDENDIKEAEELKDLGYVDEIVWFEPENIYENEGDSGPRYVETDKRNFILDYLEGIENCSHSLVIDSDEFYDREDFKRAKEVIDNDPRLVVTYCQYINYYRDYKHTLVWPFLAYVPFISKSSYRFDFKHGSFDRPSDPTRRYVLNENEQFIIFNFDIVKMHHLSFIRLDITKKLDSWSSKKYFAKVEGLREAIIDRYENYKEGQNAILMFNVPNYQVIVNKLNKQYIHPHFRIDKKPTKLR